MVSIDVTSRSSCGSSIADKTIGFCLNRIDRRHIDRRQRPAARHAFAPGAVGITRRVDVESLAIVLGTSATMAGSPTGSRAACGGESDYRGSSTHHRNRNRATQHEARSRRHPHKSSRRRRVALAHARHDCVAERAARLARDHRTSSRVDCTIQFAFVHHSCPSCAFNRSRASRTRPRNVAPGMFSAAAISSCVKSPAAASSSASRSFAGSRRICCCTSLMNSADCMRSSCDGVTARSAGSSVSDEAFLLTCHQSLRRRLSDNRHAIEIIHVLTLASPRN